MGLLKALPRMVAGKSKDMWERGSFAGMDELFARTSLGETRGNTPAVRGVYDTSKFDLSPLLDMSTEARMARAGEQGWDLHAGLPPEYNLRDARTWARSEADYENALTGRPIDEAIRPLFHGMPEPMQGDYIRPTKRPGFPEPKGISLAHQESTARQFGDHVYPVLPRGKIGNAEEFMARARQKMAQGMNEADASAATQQEFIDEGFTGVRWGQRETTMFSPVNVRSVDAAFDPAKKDSSNLLAALALASLASGGGLLSRAREQSRAAY